jgi:hypothetical protein
MQVDKFVFQVAGFTMPVCFCIAHLAPPTSSTWSEVMDGNLLRGPTSQDAVTLDGVVTMLPHDPPAVALKTFICANTHFLSDG